MNREPRTLDTGLKKDTSSKLTRHHPNSNPPKSTQLTTQLSSTQLNSTRNPAHPVCLAGQSSAQHSAALAQPIAKQKGQPSADVSSNHFHLHQPQYVRGGSPRPATRSMISERKKLAEGGGGKGGREGADGVRCGGREGWSCRPLTGGGGQEPAEDARRLFRSTTRCLLRQEAV